MALTLITPPAHSPVLLSEAKAHLRVDHNSEDALIASYIEAATEALDGREGHLGRAIITQTWRFTLDAFEPVLRLPMPPVSAVDSVTYLSAAGIETTLPPTDYQVAGLFTLDGATLTPAYGKSWPATLPVPEAVRVTFTAGTAKAPPSIKAAILKHVGYLYENRELAKALPGDGYDGVTNHRTWGF